MKTSDSNLVWRRTASAFLWIVLSSACSLVSGGAAEPAKPDDANGTWRWRMARPNGNGQPIEMSMNLKQDGEKLNGAQFGPGGELPIHNGQFKDGKISFEILRERGGEILTNKYEGTLKGDKIEGKFEVNFAGEPRIVDWNAKREAPKVKRPLSLTGTWQWTFTTPSGQVFEPRVRLKHSGDKISGSILWGETAAEISEGEISDGRVSFQVVREREGRNVTTKFRGKVTGDSIQGKMESDWGGDVQIFDWQAKRISETN